MPLPAPIRTPGSSIPGGALLALLAFAGGCSVNHAEVTIVPRDDGTFERTLALRKEVTLTEAMLRQARRHHGDASETDEAHVFRRTFRTVPEDLLSQGGTNAGSWVVLRCPAGSVTAWRERRPGPMDAHARVDAAEKDIATVVTAAVALVSRDAPAPGTAGLADRFRADLTRDLRDLYYAVLATRGLPSGDRPAVEATVVQFLVERGYQPAEDLDLRWVFLGEDRDLTLRILERFARRFESLRLLLERSGRSLEDLADRIHGAPEIDGEVVLAGRRLLHQAAGLPEDTPLRLTYHLRLPREASLVSTNGRPGDEPLNLRWADETQALPSTAVYHAAWAIPDRAWQERSLGSVLLTGEALAEFTGWYRRLSPSLVRAFDRALADGHRFAREGVFTPLDLSDLPEADHVLIEEGNAILRDAFDRVR